MIAGMVILALSLLVMGAISWHAHKTLPPGHLPMGRTEEPNTTRAVVLVQVPAIYVLVMLFIATRDIVSGARVDEQSFSPGLMTFMAIVMLLTQQAQFWGVRRIMRNCAVKDDANGSSLKE